MRIHSSNIAIFCCFFLLLVPSPALTEKDHIKQQTEHEATSGTKHDNNYDHLAVAGSRQMQEEMEKLDLEEAKTRLMQLVDHMDKNKDEKVDMEELTDWIKTSFRQLDQEEADNKFDEKDEDKSGSISWEEMLRKLYGYTLDEVQQFLTTNDPEIKKILQSIVMDNDKFLAADANHDGGLNKTEHFFFLNPAYYEPMHKQLVNETLYEYDFDKDGSISMNEYISDDDDHETKKIDKENFENFDADKDGKLNIEEMKTWLLPDHKEAARKEAKHLIDHSDVNEDRAVNIAEVLDNYEFWINSSSEPLSHEEL